MQLETLSGYCKEIADTRSARTVTTVLRNLEARNHLCEVYKFAKLIMVKPATNSTSERTFSLLKLIKTYLRSTMTQGRLNHMMILSAYKNRLDEMDFRKVSSIFIQKNDGQRNTFGRFEFFWRSIFKMVYSPFEYFCKFLVEEKKQKQASLKSQKVRIFKNRCLSFAAIKKGTEFLTAWCCHRLPNKNKLNCFSFSSTICITIIISTIQNFRDCKHLHVDD